MESTLPLLDPPSPGHCPECADVARKVEAYNRRLEQHDLALALATLAAGAPLSARLRAALSRSDLRLSA